MLEGALARPPAALVALFAAACASTPAGPEETLQRYREAIVERDASTLHALSDATFRSTWDEARLERWLDKNPRLAEEAEARLEAPIGRLSEEAILPVEGGRIRLVREPDGWKVAEGGVLVARFDTPEAALETFFFAATGHLGLLRQLIPEAAQSRFASDSELGRHLHAMQERIFRARDAIGALTPGRAIIDGPHATIPYGDGKSAELILEGDRWRVVDVE